MSVKDSINNRHYLCNKTRGFTENKVASLYLFKSCLFIISAASSPLTVKLTNFSLTKVQDGIKLTNNMAY